jgi:hypothetical protein
MAKRRKIKPRKQLTPKLGRNYRPPYAADTEDHSQCLNPACKCKGLLAQLGPAVGRPNPTAQYRGPERAAPAPVVRKLAPREFVCPGCGFVNPIDAANQEHGMFCFWWARVKTRKFPQLTPPTYHLEKFGIKHVKGARQKKVETTPFWERFKNSGERTPDLTDDDLKRKSPPFGRGGS